MLAVGATCFGGAGGLVGSVAQHAGEFYRDGDLPSATMVLQRGVAQLPDSAQLHFMLGNAYFRAGQWQLAIQEYRESAAIQPGQPDAFLSLGYACYHDGRYGDAVRAWKAAVAVSPGDALPYVSLALGLIRERNADQGEVALAEGMQLDPNWRQRLAIDVRCTPQMVHELDAFMALRRVKTHHAGDAQGPEPGHLEFTSSTSQSGPRLK